LFLSPEQAPLIGKEYSEATAAKLEEKVKGLIGERATAVRELLTLNRALLEQGAKGLLQLEVMEAERFYGIIGGSVIPQGDEKAGTGSST
jgi:cell division protease FtsH